MKANFNVTIPFKNAWYDARGYTWKAGRIAPREDGLHGETQISDEAMDKNLVKRLFIEGLGFLLEQLKEYIPTAKASRANDPTTAGGVDIPTKPNDTIFQDDMDILITLAGVNDRSEATKEQISALCISYITNYIVAGWYRMVEPSREQMWLNKNTLLETRMASALRYKHEPDEPS